MRLIPLNRHLAAEFVKIEQPNLTKDELEKRTERILTGLIIKRLDPNHALLFFEDESAVGIVRWRINSFDSRAIFETLGSPIIDKNVDQREAIALVVEHMLKFTNSKSILGKLTIEKAKFFEISEETLKKYGIKCTYHSQAFGRSLKDLIIGQNDFELIEINEENMGLAASVLHKIQSDSLDPTAKEDLTDTLGVLEERIESGMRLSRLGGSAENFLVFHGDQIVGMLMPRFTHPLQKRGGMFLGVVPEFRNKQFGSLLHLLGLDRLRELGVEHYWGETFVGNHSMKRIFASNQCLPIPDSDYWEYMTEGDG